MKVLEVVMSEWISVDVEKPSKYEDVIILADGEICFGTLDIDGDYHFINNESMCNRKATHWMPLPEPPK